MAHSDDPYFAIIVYAVNDKVRLYRVDSDRGIDLIA